MAAQVDLPVTGNVAVNLATHVDLTFGVNQQNAFFVVETAGPQFAVSGTASADLDLATRLGFLGVTITNGTVSLPTAMAVRLQDPNTDSPATSGRITSGELLIANGLSLIAPSVSGTAEAQLPLSTDLFPDTATLHVTWADALAPAVFTLNTAEIQKYYNFNALTAQAARDGLAKLPTLFNRLTDSYSVRHNLAFVGSNFGGIVHLADDVQQDLAGFRRHQHGPASAVGAGAGAGPAARRGSRSSVGADNVRFGLHFQQGLLVNQPVGYAVNEALEINGTDLNLQLSGTANVQARSTWVCS